MMKTLNSWNEALSLMASLTKGTVSKSELAQSSHLQSKLSLFSQIIKECVLKYTLLSSITIGVFVIFVFVNVYEN